MTCEMRIDYMDSSHSIDAHRKIIPMPSLAYLDPDENQTIPKKSLVQQIITMIQIVYRLMN